MLVLNQESEFQTGNNSDFNVLEVRPDSIGVPSMLMVDKTNGRLVCDKANGNGSTYAVTDKIGVCDKAFITIYFLNGNLFYQLHRGSVVFEKNGNYFEYFADGTIRRKTIVNKETTFKKVINEKTRKSRMVTVYADISWQDFDTLRNYIQMYVKHHTNQPDNIVEYYLDNCFFTLQLEKTVNGFYSKPLSVNDAISGIQYAIAEPEEELDFGEEVPYEEDVDDEEVEYDFDEDDFDEDDFD